MTESGNEIRTATFGAGCFWGVEAAFRKVQGVTATAAGYMGGATKNPTYEQICSGETGHAEVVQVTYDPARVTYDELLSVFWSIHNPTRLNRQGPDIGSNYRSVIFYHDAGAGTCIPEIQEELQVSGRLGFGKIVTAIQPATEFWRAEEYHQQYGETQRSCFLRDLIRLQRSDFFQCFIIYRRYQRLCSLSDFLQIIAVILR